MSFGSLTFEDLVSEKVWSVTSGDHASAVCLSSISRCFTQKTAPASSTQAFQPYKCSCHGMVAKLKLLKLQSTYSHMISTCHLFVSFQQFGLQRRAVGLSSWEPPPSFSKRSARADITLQQLAIDSSKKELNRIEYCSLSLSFDDQ